jgi:hypothetical protein
MWVSGSHVYAELLANTRALALGKGKTGEEKEKASGVMLEVLGFAGQGRPWRKQRARLSPMPIGRKGNDAPRGNHVSCLRRGLHLIGSWIEYLSRKRSA